MLDHAIRCRAVLQFEDSSSCFQAMTDQCISNFMEARATCCVNKPSGRPLATQEQDATDPTTSTHTLLCRGTWLQDEDTYVASVLLREQFHISVFHHCAILWNRDTSQMTSRLIQFVYVSVPACFLLAFFGMVVDLGCSGAFQPFDEQLRHVNMRISQLEDEMKTVLIHLGKCGCIF